MECLSMRVACGLNTTHAPIDDAAMPSVAAAEPASHAVRSPLAAAGFGGRGSQLVIRGQDTARHGWLRYRLRYSEAMVPPSLATQVAWLFVLALPVASIAWTVTHEEIFREPREWAAGRSRTAASLPARKLYYVCTCEYCFSHYVAAAFIALSEFQLLLAGWRGYVIAWFALVAVANLYMSLYGRLRVDIKSEGLEAKVKEQELAERR
jgi:hypothetical protein